MSDSAHDRVVVIRMLEENIQELREKDPDHALLKFADTLQGKRNFTTEERAEFVEQFAKEKKTTAMHANINYVIALEKALGKRE